MRSLRRKRVSLFPKNQKKKLKEQSNPIQFRSIPPACEPRVLRVEVETERETILKSPENKKVFRFFFFLSSFLIEINLNCFLEKPQDKRHQRGWKNASDLVYKAYPSDTFACVCVPTTGTTTSGRLTRSGIPANIVMHMPKSVGSYLDGLA